MNKKDIKVVKIIIMITISGFILLDIFGIIYSKKVPVDQHLTKAVYDYKDITLKVLKDFGFKSCSLDDKEEKIFVHCSNEIENEGSKFFYITAKKNKKNQLIKSRSDFFWTDENGVRKSHVEIFSEDMENTNSTEYIKSDESNPEMSKMDVEIATDNEFDRMRNKIVKKIEDEIRDEKKSKNTQILEQNKDKTKKTEKKETILLKDEIYSKIINDQEYKKKVLKVFEKNQIKNCTVSDKIECKYIYDNLPEEDAELYDYLLAMYIETNVTINFDSTKKDDEIFQLNKVNVIVERKDWLKFKKTEKKYKYDFATKTLNKYDEEGEQWEIIGMYVENENDVITKVAKIYDEILAIPR